MFQTNMPICDKKGHPTCKGAVCCGCHPSPTSNKKDCGPVNLVTTKLLAALGQVRTKGFCTCYFALSNQVIMDTLMNKLESAYKAATKTEATYVNSTSGLTDSVLRDVITGMDSKLDRLVEERHESMLKITNLKAIIFQMKSQINTLA